MVIFVITGLGTPDDQWEPCQATQQRQDLCKLCTVSREWRGYADAEAFDIADMRCSCGPLWKLIEQFFYHEINI